MGTVYLYLGKDEKTWKVVPFLDFKYSVHCENWEDGIEFSFFCWSKTKASGIVDADNADISSDKLIAKCDEKDIFSVKKKFLRKRIKAMEEQNAFRRQALKDTEALIVKSKEMLKQLESNEYEEHFIVEWNPRRAAFDISSNFCPKEGQPVLRVSKESNGMWRGECSKSRLSECKMVIINNYTREMTKDV